MSHPTITARGDFSWADPVSRAMLEDAYNVITTLGYWDWLSTFDPGSRGFMDNHSGATMGITMRHMHCIAQHGWDTYMKTYGNPCYPKHAKI
jgi:hypothetical protein